MKKVGKSRFFPREKLKLLTKFYRVLFLFALFLPVGGLAQEKRFTFEFKRVPVSRVYLYVEKNSPYSFVYNTWDVQKIGIKDYKFQHATLHEILDQCLEGTDFIYEIRDHHVIIRAKGKERVEEWMEVKGRVISKDGAGLPGVTILLKGTFTGSTTDANGNYSICVPRHKAMLIFSFVGMKTQEVDCKGRQIVDVVMEEEVQTMEDAVVLGYQSMGKRDVVGSVTTVKASDIMMPACTSVDQMLQGRVAGMMVMNTSSRVNTSPKIRIRGTSTILGNQAPLWVVDGVIQPDPLPLNQNDLMMDDLKNILGNQISWLNPADIESITVLKDASATAVYGSKAANGVIVISTKKGKSDRMTVNYNGTFSFRARPHYGSFNLMNSRERIQFSREAFCAGAVYQEAPVSSMNTYEGIMSLFYDKKISMQEAECAVQRLEETNTDWFSLLTRNSFSHNHNLSISGGNEKMTYNASLGYNEQSGVEKNNDGRNLSGRLNIGIQLHPKVHLDMSLTGSINQTDGYAAGVDPMGYATTTSRSVLAYDENGKRYFQRRRGNYALNENPVILGYHILNEMEHSYSKNKSSLLNGNLNFSWEMLPGLKYEFVGGINNNSGVFEAYAGEQTYYVAQKYRGYDFGMEGFGSEKYQAAMLPCGGELYNGSSDVLGWNVQHKLIVQKTFKEEHRVNVLLGAELSQTKTKNRSEKIYGYVAERGESLVKPTPIHEIVPIGGMPIVGWGILDELYNGAGWNRTTLTSNQFSVFATLAYSLKNRYVLNVSIRNDASNRFGTDQNKRFDPTYSFGLSWNIADEPWLNSISNVLNQFNMRGSYGIQGNTVNTIGPELILNMGTLKPYYGEYMSTIFRIPNPHLAWERTKTWNFGLDVQMIRWITMNLEYYRKSSNNIVNQHIALEYGRDGTEVNGGVIINSGVEYTLNITPVRTKNWAWTIGLNSSKNWNKAKTQSVSEIYLRDFLSGSADKVLKKGYAVSSFWSFDYRGLNGQNGMPEFNRLYQENGKGDFLTNEEGNPVLAGISDYTDMLVYSGKAEPDFTGGLTTRLRWKDFTFAANFSLLFGAKTRLSNPYPANGNIPLSDVNLSKDLNKRWRIPGDENVTDIPGVYTGRVVNNILLQDGNSYNVYEMWGLSDALVVRSDFFRCQQMALTWNANEKVCMRLKVKSLSLNAVVNNVFVVADKKFHGFDPELGNSILPKIYSLGVTVGF